MTTVFTKRPFILILLLILSISIGVYVIRTNNKNRASIQKQIPISVSPGVPERLTIPAINVRATISAVGVTSSGDMDVPPTIADVGWFKLGSRPGEKGSAVLSGHVNGPNGEPGVFANLSTLKQGDTVFVKDDKGTAFTFVVRETRSYNPGYAEEIFSANDITRLNLITCDGIWNTNNQRYTKRLVVFTELTQVQ